MKPTSLHLTSPRGLPRTELHRARAQEPAAAPGPVTAPAPVHADSVTTGARLALDRTKQSSQAPVGRDCAPRGPGWAVELERRFGNIRCLPEILRPPFPDLVQPKNPKAPERLPADKPRRAMIVGGGLAGLSAALELAEAGYQVTLREAQPELGGRLSTHETHDKDGDYRVEHGLHMWFNNYHVFKDLRCRLGIDDKFVPYERVDFRFRDYQPETLESRPKIYPLNLVGLVARSPNYGFGRLLKDGLGDFNALKDVLYYDHEKVFQKYDGITAEQWAKEKGLSPKFFDLFIEPAAAVTLNDPKKISAAEMIHMMHEYFISQPRAMDREVTTTDHGTAVIDPWRQRLLDLGVKIESGKPVDGLRFEGGKVVGEVGDATAYDHVVLGTDVRGTQKILARSTADAQSRAGLEAVQKATEGLKVAPHYAVLRVKLDKKPDADRPKVLETPQHAPINLVAQFDRLEDASRAWSDEHGGSVLEFHLYNSPQFEGKSRDQIWNAIRPTVVELFPELDGAQVQASYLNSKHDFTSYEVGQASLRPKSDAPAAFGIPNLALAGDWVKTDYPCALMERAVATGREAANHAKLADGVRQRAIPHTRNFGPGLL